MTDSETKIITRKLRYSGPAFEVYRYKAEVAGRTVTREIIEQKHGVVAVPIDVDGNVILLSEYCAGSNSFILSLPGGKTDLIDVNKMASEAMRELREETGFRAQQMIKLRFAWSHPSTSNRRSHVFLAYDLVWDPLPESSNEIIRTIKVPLNEAIENSYADFASDVSTIGNLLMARDKLRNLGHFVG